MANRKDLIEVPMTIEWTKKPNRKHFLEHLIKENKYTSMAEVGVRDGRTTFFLLDHCPSLTIYGVDLSSAGYYNDAVKEKYGDRLIPIQGNSHEVYDQVPAVDLVFIDADHSYIGCKGDILAYRSKVKPKGILAGHDIDYPGVNQAVNEMINFYEVGPNNVWFIKI
jgi:predicted O-methyltransferase YrrM